MVTTLSAVPTLTMYVSGIMLFTEETLGEMRSREIDYLVGTPKGKLRVLEQQLLDNRRGGWCLVFGRWLPSIGCRHQ